MSGLRVVCAPNGFKGSLTAPAAAAALAAGARRAGATAVEHPVADGGEGTAEALLAALGGSWVEVPAVDPLGRPLPGRYALLADGTAVVELALASGLTLLGAAERDPRVASSLGTGLVLRHALEAGHPAILALGGSATVDGGAGVLAGLGARLLDADGQALAPSGATLELVAQVDLTPLPSAWRGRVRVACDVDSPLLGPQGAAAVFGPQKGADSASVALLERGLSSWAEVLGGDATASGTGAAGGVGFALAAALDAELLSGAELVLEASGFAAALEGAQLCLTGEGRLDGQTRTGKAPWAVAQACRRAGVTPVAIAGALGPGAADLCGPNGFAAVFSAQREPLSLEQALARAESLLTAQAEQVARLFREGPTRSNVESTG